MQATNAATLQLIFKQYHYYIITHTTYGHENGIFSLTHIQSRKSKQSGSLA